MSACCCSRNLQVAPTRAELLRSFRHHAQRCEQIGAELEAQMPSMSTDDLHLVRNAVQSLWGHLAGLKPRRPSTITSQPSSTRNG